MNARPRILLFTGDGKGKTTAALGMALRARGHGMPVCLVQFVKSDSSVGEVAAARDCGIEVIQTGLGFIPTSADPRFALHCDAARDGLRQAREIIVSRRFAMVILDEVCLAVARELLDEQAVLEVLRQAPAEMCLVLTGRNATPALVALADTVTDMRCVKHALPSGRAAEQGVER
jgi:cob(I)alamin adenosyltransferase